MIKKPNETEACKIINRAKAKMKWVYQPFNMSKEFMLTLEYGLTNLNNWVYFDEESFNLRYNGFKKRYPNRDYIPFARRYDNDDVACFEVGKGDTVIIVHDFASSGWEERQHYANFVDWFKFAMEEFFMSEKELGKCIVSKYIEDCTSKFKWCFREKSINGDDNGWRFMSEKDSFKNIQKAVVYDYDEFTYIDRLIISEPAIWQIIDLPIGTELELVFNRKEKYFVDKAKNKRL